MKSRTHLIMGILVILVIALLAGAVTAVVIQGDAQVDYSNQHSTTQNSATVEKNVNVKLQNKATVKDATNGGTDTATSGDGKITVSLDSNIKASGKTTGTGTAILNGSVKAEGSDDGAGNAVINSSITSTVALDSGNKGTAEGEVCSSGSASATYNGTELQTNVSGSSSASGKVQSACISILNATGGISSGASTQLLDADPAANALIYADVYGENQASGGAWASGNASATAEAFTIPFPGNATAYVTGSTKADGSGKGSGGFSSDAVVSSEAENGITWGYVESNISSRSSVWSGTGKYTATASSSASTPVGKQNTAYYGTVNLEENELYANTSGTAKSSASICDSKGEAGSESQILAFADVPMEAFALGFGPEFAYLNFTFSPEYADGSVIRSDAWATGYDKNAKVSAAGSTKEGAADAMLVWNGEIPSGVYISNTSATGDITAKVDVKGCGEAYADSQIASFDLIGADEGTFSLDLINPVEESVTLPQVPDTQNLPNSPITGDLSSINPGLLQQLPAPQLTFDLPPIDVLEISIISQSVSASGSDSGKKTAEACADGETAADGLSVFTEILEASGSSSAAGTVAGGAEAGAKCDHDPASASFIVGVSAQGIGVPFVVTQLDGQGAEASGLDATLIGSTSGAASGKTWGTATGDANAAGGFGSLLLSSLGPSGSSGTVSTSANANGGLGLSAAAIGSADYATDTVESDPSLVDVALIGTGAFSAGTAGAHAYANGQTDANGSILHQTIIGDPIYLTELNITSDAFAIGKACSDVSTKNGVALAADAILSGEGTGISFDNGGVSAGETAGSIVGQAAFAQQFGKSGSAKADTFADGEAGTSSTYYSDLGLGRYFSADGVTNASGTVSGSANAGCGDPLSVSAIVAYNDFGGSLDESFAGIGEAYNAALVGSLSASSGKSADTWGSANGTAFADSTQVLNTTTAGNSLYITNSTSSADATVRTTASTTSDNGFALGVAAQGASSESESSIDDVDTGGGHAITLDGALSLADDNGKATAFVNMQELVCKDKKGKVKEIKLVPVEGREATALAQFTADLDDDFVPDGNFTSTSVSGSHAITTAEAAKGGFGLSLAGEASGSLTDVNSISGTIDQDVFSVIAGLAAADTDCSKETAKASADAGGDTSALNYAQIPGWNGTQSSQAQGDVSAYATASDMCKDPFAASLILALGENEVYPDPVLVYVPAMNTSDSTLIATLSATGGDNGKAGGSAKGSAGATGSQVTAPYDGYSPIVAPSANASSTADVTSYASAVKGEALGVSGVGSTSDAHVDINLETVTDENLLFSYAAGEGYGKKSKVDACASYDAVGTATADSNILDIDPVVPKVVSNASAAGKGVSTVQVSDGNEAEALTFGWVQQNASINYSIAFSPGNDPANASHADALALFGAEVNATNDAKGTFANADMTKVNLSAAARAGPYNNIVNIPEDNATVSVANGHTYAFLDPDGGTFHNGFLDWDTLASYTETSSGNTTQGFFVTGDLTSDPNYGYTHGGSWADSDNPSPVPFPPRDYILPMLPPF